MIWTKIDYADPETWPDAKQAYDFLRCFPGFDPGTWIWVTLHGEPRNIDEAGFDTHLFGSHQYFDQSQEGWPDPEFADWWRDADPGPEPPFENA